MLQRIVIESGGRWFRNSSTGKNPTLENVKLVPNFVEQELNSFLFCDPLKRHWPLDSRVWIVLKVDRCEF